jgi:glutaconyl-CoA/methylmalonyl-CoA decarboxylase subunit gamma
MLYYINLNGREFPLTLAALARTGPTSVATDSGAVEVELLSHTEQDRPAVVLVDGALYRVRSTPRSRTAARAGAAAGQMVINGQPVAVLVETELQRRARPIRNKEVAAGGQVTAPMPGRIVKVNVSVGDVVAVGDPLLGIEAMKMENELLSPSAGKVSKLNVQVGAIVEADQELIVIEPG